MPNLIYLYTSGGAPKCDMKQIPKGVDLSGLTNNRFAVGAETDGMVNMFNAMQRQGYFDQVHIVIDSVRSVGTKRLSKNTFIYVVPSMAWTKHLIKPGDIVIVRGGFKPWLPFLDYLHKRQENWILFYRANTNRGNWTFWDITLNDLIAESQVIRGRLHYNFSKPVNEDIFDIIDAPDVLYKEYDIMIGASHIHRRKGQFLAVQALQEYYRLYGIKPKAILPGGFLRCSTNRMIQDILKSPDVDIEGPVPMSRSRLAWTMNRTKLFVHAGPGGQNDRGILEAMACGCVTVLYGKSHVSPGIWDNSVPTTQDPKHIAQVLHAALDSYNDLYEPEAYKFINGLHEVAIPKLAVLLKFIAQHPKPDRQAVCEWSINRRS